MKKDYFEDKIKSIRLEREALDKQIRDNEKPNQNAYRLFTNELVEKSILLLKVEFEKIKPILDDIKSAQGARTDISSDVLSKEFIENMLGLKHKQAWEIKKLTQEAVDLAISDARENNRLATRSLALRLIKKNKKDEINQNIEITPQNDSDNNINENNQTQNTTLYNVIHIDLTNSYNKNDLSRLPIAENAICFVWTKPNDLSKAFSTINELSFVYQNSLVWDKDVKNTNNYIKNHHELLLIGLKNKYEIDTNNKFIFDSIYFEHQTSKTTKPDYYYSSIEKICPNQKYLEVFSDRKYSDKWTVFGGKNE